MGCEGIDARLETYGTGGEVGRVARTWGFEDDLGRKEGCAGEDGDSESGVGGWFEAG